MNIGTIFSLIFSFWVSGLVNAHTLSAGSIWDGMGSDAVDRINSLRATPLSENIEKLKTNPSALMEYYVGILSKDDIINKYPVEEIKFLVFASCMVDDKLLVVNNPAAKILAENAVISRDHKSVTDFNNGTELTEEQFKALRKLLEIKANAALQADAGSGKYDKLSTRKITEASMKQELVTYIKQFGFDKTLERMIYFAIINPSAIIQEF